MWPLLRLYLKSFLANDIDLTNIEKIKYRGVPYFAKRRTYSKFLFWDWENVLGLMFRRPTLWLKCYYFRFLGLKIQPNSQNYIFRMGGFIRITWVEKLCFGAEISSEPTPEQFWGCVFNPRMFLCFGVYDMLLII